MSYAIIQQPDSIAEDLLLVSAGNDAVYTVTGTTQTAPNVVDYKFIADVYVNGVLQTTLKSFPDPQYGFGVFNLKNIAANFVSYDFLLNPITETNNIFYNCPNSSAEIYIKFGEEYSIGSSTGSTFVQNKNLVQSETGLYINSSLSFDDYIYWNQDNDFVYFIAKLFLQWNNYNTDFSPSSENQKAFTNQRKFLFFVNGVSFPALVASLQVTTTDANGDTVGVYNIAASGVTTAVQAVEVGYGELSSSSYTVVSGFDTMFGNGNETGYNVYTLNSDNDKLSEIVYYDILTDCGKYAPDAVTIHWLNSFGGFDSWLFNKKNETTQARQASTYKKTYGTLNADGSYSINQWDSSTKQYYTKLQNSININTDFLTDIDVLYLEGLFNSPVVYMEDQIGNVSAITVKENSYKINKVVNKKIFSLSLTIEPAMQDFRQPQ